MQFESIVSRVEKIGRPVNECVAIYLPSFAFGDAHMVAAMAPLLSAAGFRPLVFVDRAGGAHRDAITASAEVMELVSSFGRKSVLPGLAGVFAQLRNLLAFNQPSWLLTSHTATGAAIGVLAAKSCGVDIRTGVFITGAPRAGRSMTGGQRLAYRLLGAVIARADSVFVDAQYVSEAWAPFLQGRKPIFLGRVPLSDDLPTATDRRDESTTPEIKAVIIARFSEQKRLDVAIKAIAILRRNGVSATLQILGADPENLEIRSLIAKEGVLDAVRIAGFVGNVEEYLQKADIYLQSSDWEPLGMAILEALNLGKRVVSTDCAGPCELLRDGIGWLAPRGEADTLAQKMLEALRAPAFDLRRRDRAREYSLSVGMTGLLSALRSGVT